MSATYLQAQKFKTRKKVQNGGGDLYTIEKDVKLEIFIFQSTSNRNVNKNL